MTKQALLRGIGISLMVVAALGLVSIGARAYVLANFDHAVVRLFNVNDLMTVSVNCRVAGVVAADKTGRVDLGWLQGADDIYISAYNRSHGAAWGYRLDVNGERRDGDSRGSASSAGYEAAEHSVVMSRGYGANGKLLGTLGCAGPTLVSSELSRYTRVAEASPRGAHPLPRWRASTSPFNLIDGLGRWAPGILAVLGFLSAAANSRIRAFITERWEWNFVLAVVGVLMALAALHTAMVGLLVVGTALLFLTAFLYLKS
jgi:hypothetical protein